MSDQEFEAAVLQLDRGRWKQRVKFGAMVMLCFITVFAALALGIVIGDTIREISGAAQESAPGPMPEADVP